ncbi:MAG: hypothetical protein IT204_16845 [Fimbriimonadaceae bacterium]|nr:hypothetical protein [Fimbriimonadaceae bacterium]
MSNDQEASPDRGEQLGEAVDKAKAGAKKLLGWLGRGIGAAADAAKANPALRDKIEQVEQFVEDRAENRLFGALARVYDDHIAALARVIESLKEEITRREESIEHLQVNINALRNQGKPSSDPELAEYNRAVREMRLELREYERAQEPYNEEIAMMQRLRRAALARLQADASLAEQLQTEADRQVEESKVRLEQLADQEQP